MVDHNGARAAALAILTTLAVFTWNTEAQGLARVLGHVTDQLGGSIAGASVKLIDQDGKEQVSETDELGGYSFNSLIPGIYRLVVTKNGFAPYEQTGLLLREGQKRTIDFRLTATVGNQKLTIKADQSLSTDPTSNKTATVISGDELDALPDDPDEIRTAISVLVGRSGPGGVDFYYDGFSQDTALAPSKQTIRQIVINQNPFAAEYDRIGFARVDVLTKPGSSQIHGGGEFDFSDAVLNSRNPYGDTKPPYQRRIYNANLSGPLFSKKASFFFSVSRREPDESVVIDATVLDQAFKVTNLRQVVPAPQRFLTLSPRFDFQLSKATILSLRYTYDSFSYPVNGVGTEHLISTALDDEQNVNQLNVTAVSILNPKVVNEARFQYYRWRQTFTQASSDQQIQVLDAFTGGGADVGHGAYLQHEFEIHNYTTVSSGPHTLKFGGRLRFARIRDINEENLTGTYIFAGGPAPELDRNNQAVLGPDGLPKLINVTSIEIYRRTLLFQALGFSPSEIRALGGEPSQYLITTGNPFAQIQQVDLGAFVQDDWRLRPNFTLSLGLRYQVQTNARSNGNFVPRAAFAWTPWVNSGGKPQTVIRGGAGIFYNLVRTPLTLSATHMNGLNERQFIVTDPAVLDSFPNRPPSSVLSSLPQTTTTVSRDLEEPRLTQGSISIEQGLPHNVVLTVSYLYARALHLARTRNINAPLPDSGIRPLGNLNNLYEIESNGIYNQELLVFTCSARPARWLSLSANYSLGYTNSDTDGQGTFPASSYDLRAEYGRAITDIRNKFVLRGVINLPWSISFSPFLLAQSGPPFNITTGLDNNNDSVFTDRPAFATDLTKPSVVVTPFGAFDLAPGPGEKIIPRYFGQNPGYFSLNLRVAKTKTFGESSNQKSGSGGRSYKVTAGVYAANVLNHTNPGPVTGNLSSPQFGTSNQLLQIGQRSASSNRSLNLFVTFGF